MHDALVYGDVAGSETCVPRMLFIRKNVDTLIRGDANRIKIMRLTIALQLQEWEKEERAAAIEPVAVFDMLDA